MDSSESKSMIQVIENFLDDFENDRKTIDPKLGSIQYNKKSFGGGDEYSGTLSDHLASAITSYKKYKDSKNMWTNYYISECYHWIIKAKSTNAIIAGNQTVQEVEKYKQENESLKNKLKDAESKIERLLEEKGELKGRISMYERDMPKSDTFDGDVDE